MEARVLKGKAFQCHGKHFIEGDKIPSNFWEKDGERQLEILVKGGWCEYVEAPKVEKAPEVEPKVEEKPVPKKRGRKKKGDS